MNKINNPITKSDKKEKKRDFNYSVQPNTPLDEQLYLSFI